MNERYAPHVAEMQRRWEAAMLAAGYDGVLVHAGEPRRSFLDDYEYAFRPNPHFLAWLPLTRHARSVLLVRPGEKPRLWYYQPEDYWYQPPADPQPWWADRFEIRVVHDPECWRNELPAAARALAAIGDATGLDRVVPPEDVNPERLVVRLHLERTRKTPWEIDCIDRANQQAAAAHVAAEQAFREGHGEFDIHLRYLRAARQNDAELPYGSIVALNEHGAVLHYQERARSAPDPVRSFLIDAGCTVHAYAADITRTHAASSGEFADLIGALDGIQRRLVAAVRPGLDYRELHLRAHREIAGILVSAGVTFGDAEGVVASGLSSVFFPHGLGHFIGLQTHDVAGLIDDDGQAIPRPDGHPFLRLTRTLAAGNVLTIEPGIYFIEPLLRHWRNSGDPRAVNWQAVERLAPYGGVRIEDNVVVTADGSENLTRAAFSGLGAQSPSSPRPSRPSVSIRPADP
jgi:Xaa-Pro dipeptidase